MTDQAVLAPFVKPTLIEIMAPHCVECRAMQPDLDAVAEANDGAVDFIAIDATREMDFVSSLGVMGTPTLIAVKDGAEVARFTGRRSRSELQELFTAVAVGEAEGIAKMSGSDRLVWSLAGALLTGAGLISGPAWVLVVLGAGLVAYANLRRAGTSRRR